MSDATIRDAAVAKINEAITLLAGISSTPGGTYGASLPARMAATTGTVRNCSTLAQLKSACALGGDIRIPAGTTIDVGTDLNLALTVAGTAGSPNQISGGKIIGRVLINSNYWRIKNVEITGSPYDGVKIADGANAAHVEVNNCWIHDVGNWGIITGNNTSSDIQIWNNLIERVGQAYPVTATGMHCIFPSGPTSNWVIGSNLLRPRNGFGVYIYPTPVNVLCVANTTIGGLSRGGYAIRGGSGHRIVGDIITDSPSAAFEVTTAAAASVSIEDVIQYGNALGQWAVGTGLGPGTVVTNLQSVNPLLTADGHLGAGSPALNYVQAARYPYLPAADRAGKVRMAADAGCYAA